MITRHLARASPLQNRLLRALSAEQTIGYMKFNEKGPDGPRTSIVQKAGRGRRHVYATERFPELSDTGSFERWAAVALTSDNLARANAPREISMSRTAISKNVP